MQVIHKQHLIDTIAARWQNTFQARGRWAPTSNGMDAETIHSQLVALPDHPSEAEIAAIIGNHDWTANLCDECERDVEVSVWLGADIHHPVDTKNICVDCLKAALALAEGNRTQ